MVWLSGEKDRPSSIGVLGYCCSIPRHLTGALGSDGEHVTDGAASDVTRFPSY